MSRALTETQSRYSNIECEVLGVVTGVEYFHQYLFGKNFTLYTDHKPMENLVLKPLVDTSPGIQQLMLRLTQYHMNVAYKPGNVCSCLTVSTEWPTLLLVNRMNHSICKLHPLSMNNASTFQR